MRLSLTLPVLNNSNGILFVVQGADKAQALKTVFKREATPDLLPAQRIRPERGSLIWFVDRRAAQDLAQDSQIYDEQNSKREEYP
jgi:6-phosphogluconolactonase